MLVSGFASIHCVINYLLRAFPRVTEYIVIFALYLSLLSIPTIFPALVCYGLLLSPLPSPRAQLVRTIQPYCFNVTDLRSCNTVHPFSIAQCRLVVNNINIRFSESAIY